jgi:hypothetical protein
MLRKVFQKIHARSADESFLIEQAKLIYEMLNHWQHVHLLEPSLKSLHNASFPNA